MQREPEADGVLSTGLLRLILSLTPVPAMVGMADYAPWSQDNVIFAAQAVDQQAQRRLPGVPLPEPVKRDLIRLLHTL